MRGIGIGQTFLRPSAIAIRSHKLWKNGPLSFLERRTKSGFIGCSPFFSARRTVLRSTRIRRAAFLRVVLVTRRLWTNAGCTNAATSWSVTPGRTLSRLAEWWDALLRSRVLMTQGRLGGGLWGLCLVLGIRALLSGGVPRIHSQRTDQAALPDEPTAAATDLAEGGLPTPVASQPKSAFVSLQSLASVDVSGDAFVPDSIDGTVALESPARLPSSAPESPESSRSSFTRSEIVSTATDIAMTTSVVKSLPLATIRIAGQDPPVRTLHERIRWIQDHSGGGGLSLAQIADKAEISRQALSALVRRSKKEPEKRFGSGETLEKISSAWNVDLVWLVTGKGVPRRGKLSALDTVLNERSWSESARAAALAEKRDLSADGWRHLLGSVEAALSVVATRREIKNTTRNRAK